MPIRRPLLSQHVKDAYEPLLGEVGRAHERLEVRGQPHAHRPAPAPRGGLNEGHEALVHVRPLFPVHLLRSLATAQSELFNVTGGRIGDYLCLGNQTSQGTVCWYARSGHLLWLTEKQTWSRVSAAHRPPPVRTTFPFFRMYGWIVTCCLIWPSRGSNLNVCVQTRSGEAFSCDLSHFPDKKAGTGQPGRRSQSRGDVAVEAAAKTSAHR